MLIVMNTNSSNEHGYNAEYDYAVVKLDTSEAKILSNYFKLFDSVTKSESTLIEMTFTDEDVQCEFYSCNIWDNNEIDDMPKQIRNDLDDKGWAIIPDDYVLPFTPRDARAPDATYLMISKDGFWWHTLPMDDSVTVDSESLPRDLLAQIL